MWSSLEGHGEQLVRWRGWAQCHQQGPGRESSRATQRPAQGRAGEMGQKEGCEQHLWLMGRRGEDLNDENLSASWARVVWGTCQHIVSQEGMVGATPTPHLGPG